MNVFNYKIIKTKTTFFIRISNDYQKHKTISLKKEICNKIVDYFSNFT